MPIDRAFPRMCRFVLAVALSGCAQDPDDGSLVRSAGPTNDGTTAGSGTANGTGSSGDVGLGAGTNGAVNPDMSSSGGTGAAGNTGLAPSNSGVDGGATGGGTEASTGGGGKPPLPAGAFGEWQWFEPAGARCRDGSPAGYYVKQGRSSDDLLIFMNGGGICTVAGLCELNASNVDESMHHEVLGDAAANTLFGTNATRQVPPDEGIFKRDPRNPVANWNMVYIPYCTGDLHAGSHPDASVPGLPEPQQFVGYQNFQLFLESFGPDFASASRVLLSGSSAGGFGALFNFDRVQTYFNQHGGAQVIMLADSGLALGDEYVSPCLYKHWRELWQLDAALPQDCAGCFREDGGHLVEGLSAHLKQKYPGRLLGGAISTTEDGIMRAFFSGGLNDCMVDPFEEAWWSGFNLGRYSGPKFTEGLKDAAENIFGLNSMATYFFQGWVHMHLWRARYYDVNGTDVTIAEWVQDVLDGKPSHPGGLFSE